MRRGKGQQERGMGFNGMGAEGGLFGRIKALARWWGSGGANMNEI